MHSTLGGGQMAKISAKATADIRQSDFVAEPVMGVNSATIAEYRRCRYLSIVANPDLWLSPVDAAATVVRPSDGARLPSKSASKSRPH